MTVKQLSIFVENKPGKLVEALETLGNADVDLRALSLADTSDFGILRIIVNKPDIALEVLEEAGFLVKLNNVLAVVIGDRPGGLASVVRTLSEANVNIEYTYAFVSHNSDNAYVIIRVDNNEAAIKTMNTNGITLLTGDELYGM